MSLADAVLAVLITGLLAWGVLAAVVARGPRCDHHLEPDVHEPTGRIFYSCHCGKVFDR